MKSSLVVSTILCVTAWMAGVYASNGAIPRCCDKLSTTKVSLDKIVNYVNQSAGLCDIAAIVFTTNNKNKNRTICSDPKSPWTKRAMKKVDLEKSRRGEEERTLVKREETSQRPAVSRNPQKKMKGRKRQNKGRRNRNKQRKNVKTSRGP